MTDQPRPPVPEKLERLWLHFLWSFALSDHLGDAIDAVRSFAKRVGLPVPGNYAELSGPGDDEPDDPDAYWLSWIKARGVEDGINGKEAIELGKTMSNPLPDPVDVRPTCNWKQDEDGVWDTECAERFELNDGTPADNSIRFCCYCGKALVWELYDELAGITDDDE